MFRMICYLTTSDSAGTHHSLRCFCDSFRCVVLRVRNARFDHRLHRLREHGYLEVASTPQGDMLSPHYAYLFERCNHFYIVSIKLDYMQSGTQLSPPDSFPPLSSLCLARLAHSSTSSVLRCHFPDIKRHQWGSYRHTDSFRNANLDLRCTGTSNGHPTEPAKRNVSCRFLPTCSFDIHDMALKLSKFF